MIPLLAAALKNAGGQLLFGHTLTGLTQDAGGVDALPSGRAERRDALRDALFIHARVVAAGKERAGFYKGRGAPLAELDVELAGDAYLATGLNNNWSYDNSYFWARTLGSGARRPAPVERGVGAPGVGRRAASTGCALAAAAAFAGVRRRLLARGASAVVGVLAGGRGRGPSGGPGGSSATR